MIPSPLEMRWSQEWKQFGHVPLDKCSVGTAEHVATEVKQGFAKKAEIMNSL